AAGPARRGRHRAVDRLRRCREPLPEPRRLAPVARELLLRPGPRLRLLGGPARARAALARAPSLALRLQRGRGGGPGAGGGRRPAADRRPAPEPLGGTDGVELVLGDPAGGPRP